MVIVESSYHHIMENIIDNMDGFKGCGKLEEIVEFKSPTKGKVFLWRDIVDGLKTQGV
jgi:hypothetical protein